MKDLLLEIGTEEIPASFLAPASASFKENLSKFFQENRISFSDAKTFYTPRRIALLVKKVSEKQSEQVLEVQGPPRKQAFDEQGKPTKVAEGFASAHMKKITELYTKQTAKGEYIFIKKSAEIKTIDQLLKDNLVKIISSIPFSKTMRWQDDKFRFARPIRWITLVYGTKPIKTTVAGLESSQYSQAHRMKKIPNSRFQMLNASQYEKTLKKFDVIVSAEQRKKYIEKQITILAKKVRGLVVEDSELLEEATNICEMPNPILCEFKPEFLNLPSAVLITALKTHTRSFAVKDVITNQLLPYFIAITNTPSCDVKQVRYWYEQAVESRLDDAKFYYEEDLKFGFENRVEEEKKVVWIEGLGTLFDKTARLEKLVFILSQRIPSINKDALIKSAFLSKADLLTNMVREKEYTSLQGIMGGIYAKASGENDLVAQILSEQYLPKTIGDKIPYSKEGSVLSIADKIDNIVGAFVINQIPSGSFDPLGLRRQAFAIMNVCLDKQFMLDLNEIIEFAFEYFNTPENRNLINKIKTFFRERLNAVLLERGARYDIANAVLAVNSINPYDISNRANALIQFRLKPDFIPLVIGQKRVNNILKGISEIYSVKEELLQQEQEKILYSQTKSLEPQIIEAVNKGEYTKGLELLLSLRPAIDSLFDKVLVMTDDMILKNNRLGLLQYIKSLFTKIADLSEIVVDK